MLTFILKGVKFNIMSGGANVKFAPMLTQLLKESSLFKSISTWFISDVSVKR